MAIDVLGHRMVHHVRAQVERVLAHRRHEGVIHHQQELLILRDLRDLGNIADLQRGVGGGLQPYQLHTEHQPFSATTNSPPSTPHLGLVGNGILHILVALRSRGVYKGELNVHGRVGYLAFERTAKLRVL